MTKLILGTAQFGQSYGIKGDPVPSLKEIEKIVEVAWDGGIRVIHTSWQYNLPKICGAIFDGFEKIEKYKNDPSEFFYKNFLGYSLYNISGEIEFKGLYKIFQIPINILDNRFLPFIKFVKEQTDGLIHARSVFLQGLLLMEEFPKWIPIEVCDQIWRFQALSRQQNLQPYEAALGWVLGLKDIDYVIVGVNSAGQLKQLLDVKPLQWNHDFSITDENVLDPRRWPKT